jgi:hypothetical protein
MWRLNASCLLIALLVLLSAGASSSASASAYASAYGETTVADVNAAGAKLNAAIGTYLKSGNRQPPADSAGWKSFFDHEDALLADLSAQYKHWKALLNKARSDGHQPLTRVKQYASAMGIWVRDQLEQERLSRGCYISSAGFASRDAAGACYQNLFSENGDRWNADTRRLLQALAKKK